MEETIGQTYDLGGPHVYTYNEIYEQFYNIAQIKPYIVPVKTERAIELMRSFVFSCPERYLTKHWLYPNWIAGESFDAVCRPDAKGFKDLHITPISFG